MTDFASVPGRSAMTLPVLSMRTCKPVASNSVLRNSPRRASLNSGAGISVRRICWSVTQFEFLAIQSRPRAQSGATASFSIESSVAREENVTIKRKIQEMGASFTCFVRLILAATQERKQGGCARTSACAWSPAAISGLARNKNRDGRGNIVGLGEISLVECEGHTAA